VQPGRHRLQREQLLPGPGAYRYAVGDRVAEQIVERAGAGNIGREPSVLVVALHQAALLQHPTDAISDAFDQSLQSLRARLIHVTEHGRICAISQIHPAGEDHVEVHGQI
jgi:hypothetical protein